MKNKILATMLSLSMVASMLAGCGKENTTTEPATEVQQVETEVSSEENVQESETTEIANEAETTMDAQNTENTEEISTEQEDKNYTAEDIANAIDPEHFGMEFEQDAFKIKIFTSGQDMMMNYGFFVPVDKLEKLAESEEVPYDMDKVKANGGIFLEFSMYSVGGEVYCYSNVDGTDKYTKMPASEETQGLFSEAPSEEKTGIKPENVKDVKYLETKTYDGIEVDVVEITVVDSKDSLLGNDFLGGNSSSDDEEKTANMYIDVETGKAVAIAVNEGENEFIIKLFEADVELPSEYADAEEGSYDELIGQMMAFMFLPLSFSSDDGASFNFEDEDIEFNFEDDDIEDEDGEVDFDFDFDDEVDE